MPYASVSEVPDYVPEEFRKQWLEVWNSAHKKAKEDGKSDKDAEASAFAQANGVIKKLKEEMSESKTKSVGGEDVPMSAFAYVGDPERTETWHLPIHDESHVRNALARFNQAEIPAEKKAEVARKLVAAAKKHGIDASGFEKEHLTDPPRHSLIFLLDALPKAIERNGRHLYELPICVTGKWTKGGQEFAITKETFAALVRNFEKRKNDMVVVDYEHASEMPDVARGGPVPAAGWIHELKPNGALRALVEFTPRAEEMIQAGEYRFFSPAIDWAVKDKQTGEPQGATLTSCALTNHPFLEELPPIALSELTSLDQPHVPEALKNISIAFPQQGGKPVKKLSMKQIADGEQKGHIGMFDGESPIGFVELADFRSFVKGLEPAEPDADDTKKKAIEGPSGTAVLLSEAVKDGKLDNSKAATLANAGKIQLADYIGAQDAEHAIEAAVQAGKILPKLRGFFFKMALTDRAAFDGFVKDAPKVVDLKEHGHAGSESDPAKILMAEVRQYAKDNKVSLSDALTAITKEKPELWTDYSEEVVKTASGTEEPED